MSNEAQYDVVVVGAGAGGLCAAAWLTAAGKKVLVVESLDRVGGRASSEQIDGFTVNIGAIALECGSLFEQTLAAIDMPLDVREPNPPTVFRIDGKIINISKGGGWGMLLGTFTKQAAKIGAKFSDARGGELPEAKLSTKEWLSKYTKNETVHAIFRNLCAAIFAVNSDELPARAFLTYFALKGAFKRFGFCPRGTIGIWQDFVTGIEKKGGAVWLNAPVSQFNVENGRVTSIDVVRDGVSQRIHAAAFVSNTGPKATIALAGAEHFTADYLDQAQKILRPAANIVINFATQKRLIDMPGLITFGRTQRLCNLGELTYTCPELAPPGWHMYVAYAVPTPAIGDFDEKAEIELGLQDLRNEFPEFDKEAKILSIRVMRDDWPAQRTCAGYDLPQETPISNLWNVGDGVKEYGDGGTQACAATGKKASELVTAYLNG